MNTRAQLRCDFCSAPNPKWDYPCKTFMVSANSKSLDDWLACDICHALIAADNWPVLAKRSHTLLGKDYKFLAALHQLFRANRTGEPVRYGRG